jgi:tetratricopeptide (TPR) repeat protein
MQCPACAADNPEAHRYCDACGEALATRCDACGAMGRAGARFCGQCGAPLGAGAPDAEPPRLTRGSERSLIPFVGREQELASLVGICEDATAGAGRIVAVTGAPGIGKSRLLDELRRAAPLAIDRITWLQSECIGAARAAPLQPVIDQLRGWLGLDPFDQPDAVQTKLDAALADIGELDSHRAALADLCALDTGDGEWARIDPPLRRMRIFRAVRAWWLRLAGRHPLVLAFDDLDRADSATRALLAWMADAVATAPMVVLGTAPACPPGLDGAAEVALGPLPATHIAAIAAHALGGVRLSPAGAAGLTSAAAGNPLVAEELGHALRGRDLAAIGEAEGLPGGASLWLARLDPLSDRARHAAQLVAVAGPCAMAVLERMGELTEPLDGALDELHAAGLLRQRAPWTDAVRLRHPALESAIADALPAPRHCELHRAAGVAAEDLYGSAPAVVAAPLAYHFARGEHWPKALLYAGAAGDRAAACGAADEAVMLYAAALDAATRAEPAPPAGEVARLHARRGRAFATAGAEEAAIAELERGVALAAPDGDARAAMLLELAGLYDRERQLDAAERCVDAVLAIGTDRGDAALVARALAMRAAITAAWRGPIAEARSAARAAMDDAHGLDDARLRARTMIGLGTILRWRGDYEACFPLLHEGAHLAEHTGMEHWPGRALVELGEAHRAKGRYEQALRWYAALHRYAEDAGDGFWSARAPLAVAAAYLDLADFDTAFELAGEGDAAMQRTGRWPAPHARALVLLAEVQIARGDPGAAAPLLARAGELLAGEPRGPWRARFPWLRVAAELALATGALEDAARDATAALDLATRSDARQQVAQAKLLLGEIAAAQERTDDALPLLRAALGLAEHLGATRELWRSAGTLGRLLAQLGRDRDAEAHLIQAAQTIEAIAVEVTDPALRGAFTRSAAVGDVYRRLRRRAVS